MKIKINRKDVIWNYLAILLSIGASIILVPFVLTHLNDEDTALYYIFSNLSGIAILFDFGFSPTMARSMAYAYSGVAQLKKHGVDCVLYSNPNYTLMFDVVTACKIVYSILALISLFLSLTLGTFYVKIVTKTFSQNTYLAAWIIYAFAIFLNILYSYYSAFLRGIGNIEKLNVSAVIAKLVQIIICIILLMLGAGLIGVSFSYLIYGIVFRLLAKYWFYKFENIGDKLNKAKLDINLLKVFNVIRAIWPNTWRDGVVTLSEYLLNQATTIIASLFLTLQETGMYSLSVQLISVIATFSAAIYIVFQPALQSAYVNRNKDLQKKYISLIIISYTSTFWVGIFALITVVIHIVKLLKPSYAISINIILTVGFYQFLLKFRNCYTSYISATNKVTYWKSFLYSAVLCIVLSCVLAGYFNLGLLGLLVGQLVSQLVYNAWYWPFIVHTELKLSAKETIKLGIREIHALVKGAF